MSLIKEHVFKRNLIDLIHHVWEHHKIPRTSREVFNCSSELYKYICLKCDYRTALRVNLKRHVCSSDQQNKVDFVKTYKCENCDFQTFSFFLLGKHVFYDCKNVISNGDQKLSENCGNNDESEENIDCFEKEIDKMDKNETMEIEWYCGYCFYKTQLKRDLRKHIYKEHSSMKRSNILNKFNNDTHTIKKIKWIKCSNCWFKSKRKGDLNRHILAKHTAPEEIQWFKCKNCSFQSKRKYDLKRHILVKHTAPEKIKWFKCENCLYQSKQKYSLDAHVLLKHTALEKINWFKCKDCSYKCKQKGRLNHHIQVKHSFRENKLF